MHDRYDHRLPENGSVLGVDVGYSSSRRSSAVCRLDWSKTDVSWIIQRFKAGEPERSTTLRRFADRPLMAVALDGPLRKGFETIGTYRVAEAMLTKRLQPLIGKPGQSSAPVGKMLNQAANECALLLIGTNTIAEAQHTHHIDKVAVAEAFPGAFMGVLLRDPKAVAAQRSNRSDAFYKYLADAGVFDRLIDSLLPGRSLNGRFSEVRNHDDTAGLVCALTALCVAANTYSAVGDSNGWIILPPASLIEPWAIKLLQENARDLGKQSLYL